MIFSADDAPVVLSHYYQCLVSRRLLDSNSYLTHGLVLSWRRSKQRDELIVGDAVSPVRAQ